MNFQCTSIPFAGTRVRGVVIKCGRCGRIETVPINSFKGSRGDDGFLENRFIVGKLEKSGWKVGDTNEKHRCPGCFAIIKNNADHKSNQKKIDEEFVAKTVSAVTAPKKDKKVADHSLNKAAQPREMGRDDRRIIFEKLNDVYVNADTGYGPGWTDAKVAADLGTPRAWVSKVRDEMFGPEGSEEIRAAIKETRELMSEVESAKEAFASLLLRSDKLEKLMRSVEQSLK